MQSCHLTGKWASEWGAAVCAVGTPNQAVVCMRRAVGRLRRQDNQQGLGCVVKEWYEKVKHECLEAKVKLHDVLATRQRPAMIEQQHRGSCRQGGRPGTQDYDRRSG